MSTHVVSRPKKRLKVLKGIDGWPVSNSHTHVRVRLSPLDPDQLSDKLNLVTSKLKLLDPEAEPKGRGCVKCCCHGNNVNDSSFRAQRKFGLEHHPQFVVIFIWRNFIFMNLPDQVIFLNQMI